ncbi:hematopoietic prostaglandin D synthase-like [Asterias rubens]|uniref:hematopoietic prostaglandin D synthase-like n=1 Tax=Asterias rubens TaxID=7604 RepID=UPI0014556646|nr:hematopoietic prostaglandin D synthase-like [Asterias rubens]
MPSYKLNYFNIQGRAEISRLCFVVAGVPFEDRRVDGADWPALKPTMPNGAMPVLEVDGKMLPETRAIQGYLGREFDLIGADSWETALVDVVGEMLDDLMKPLVEKVIFEKDEAKKAESAKAYFEEKGPLMLGRLEKRLESNQGGDGFFVGKKISVADIAFYTCMDHMLKLQPTVLDKYPKLKALRGRFAAEKNVATYLEKRPQSDM